MQRTFKSVFLASSAAIAIGLTACKQTNAPSPLIEAEPVASLTVTADINAGIRTQKITIIPNDIAPWLSQIILIDEEGELYQTALDSGEANSLGMNAKDAIGLMRRKAPGVLLTLSETNTLSALIETSDEGDLSSITVSAPDLSLASFCQGNTAPEDNVYALTTNGDIVNLVVLVEENESVRLSMTDRMDMAGKPIGCVKIKDQAFGLYRDRIVSSDGQQTYSMSIGEQQVAVLSGDASTRIISPLSPNPNLAIFSIGNKEAFGASVTGGLSTLPLKQINAAHIYTNSMGGVFRDGALILSDATSDRIVMISLPVVQRELTK